MDPAALAQLQAAVGEKRKQAEPAAPATGALAAPAPLTDIGTNASVLNATDGSALAGVLSFPAPDEPAMLKSDADEQLLVSLTLNQPYKLTAIRIAGPADGTAPAVVKLFANKATMSFDDCEDFQPTQVVALNGASATIPLQLTKFTSVSALTVFVESNQGDEEATCLSRLELVGLPLQNTNMKDFKKVG